MRTTIGRLFPMLALITALTGCSIISDLTGPTTGVFPPGTVQFAPDDSFGALYHKAWTDVEKCSGITADFKSAHWWVVKDRMDFEAPDEPGHIVSGYFTVPANIVLADYQLTNYALVTHEVLHYLLYVKFGTKYYGERGHPERAHPVEYFKTKCPFVAQGY